MTSWKWRIQEIRDIILSSRALVDNFLGIEFEKMIIKTVAISKVNQYLTRCNFSSSRQENHLVNERKLLRRKFWYWKYVVIENFVIKTVVVIQNFVIETVAVVVVDCRYLLLLLSGVDCQLLKIMVAVCISDGGGKYGENAEDNGGSLYQWWWWKIRWKCVVKCVVKMASITKPSSEGQNNIVEWNSFYL